MVTAFSTVNSQSLSERCGVAWLRKFLQKTMASIRCHLMGIWRLLDAKDIWLSGTRQAAISQKTMASIRCHLMGIWRLLDAREMLLTKLSRSQMMVSGY